MNTKITALVLFAVTVCAFAFTRTPNNPPSDFRDAIADEQLKNAASSDLDLQSEMSIPQPAEYVTGANSLEPRDFAAANAAPGKGVTRIFSENDPWHKRLAQALGVNYPCNIETKTLGTPMNNVTKLTFDDGRRKEAVVVKGFDSMITTAKFYPMKLLIPGTPIITNALGRLRNAEMMNEKLKSAGFHTLEVVMTDPENRVMVTKFQPDMTPMDIYVQKALKGDADAIRLIERMGSLYGLLHQSDFTLGDSRAGNVMLVNGDFYLTDLEQAAVGGNKEWDIAEIFYFSIIADKAVGTPRDWALVTRTFLQGYKAAGGDAKVIKGATSRKYQAIFGLAVPVASLDALHAVRLELRKAAEGL